MTSKGKECTGIEGISIEQCKEYADRIGLDLTKHKDAIVSRLDFLRGIEDMRLSFKCPKCNSRHLDVEHIDGESDFMYCKHCGNLEFPDGVLFAFKYVDILPLVVQYKDSTNWGKDYLYNSWEDYCLSVFKQETIAYVFSGQYLKDNFR